MTKVLVAFIAGLALVTALPFAGRALRDETRERCALDGVIVDARHAVRVVDRETAASRRFCCTTCAAAWLVREPIWPRQVFVTDEETGTELDAERASFVRSSVVAVPATGNRIHVFATESAAKRHAEEFRGTILVGDDRPLRMN